MAKSSAARKVATPPPAPSPAAVNTLKDDPSKSSDVVLVGCKYPPGIWMEVVDPGMLLDANGKPVQQSWRPNPTGDRVYVKGGNAVRPERHRSAPHYGYAVTPVPRALWERWLERHKDSDLVKNGLIFAAPSLAYANDQAKERIEEKTGLEPLAVEKDPRMKKAKTGNSEVDTDPEALARTLAAG